MQSDNSLNNTSMNVFDRDVVIQRRRRSLVNFKQHNFLFKEIAERLVDRLLDVNRQFDILVELDKRGGDILDALTKVDHLKNTMFIQTDMCSQAFDNEDDKTENLIADVEALPFAVQSIDAVISNLSFHWVNDLPGALLQIKSVLKPDGLFLASMFGGQTLVELRECLMEAEMSILNGAHSRVSPFVDVRDMGALMQRAGFSLPVVDVDTITVDYSDMFQLMNDLRGMGESNAIFSRSKNFMRRDVMMEAARLYAEKFSDNQGRIKARFDVIYLTGWTPHENQQKPLRPGSAKIGLEQFLKSGDLD